VVSISDANIVPKIRQPDVKSGMMTGMLAELPPLIQALLDAARYPHAVERVELVQTHISWVLLAGDFAYKIKKPVKAATEPPFCA